MEEFHNSLENVSMLQQHYLQDAFEMLMDIGLVEKVKKEKHRHSGIIR